MAAPAVACHYLFKSLIQKPSAAAACGSFFSGFTAVLMSGLLAGFALMFTEEQFLDVASAIVLAHVPVMIIEGIVSAFCIGFIKKVRPELLPGYDRHQSYNFV